MRWTTRWTPTQTLALDLAEVGRELRPDAGDSEAEDSDESLPNDWVELLAHARASQAKLQLHEVSCRVARGRFLLRAGKLNRFVHGCLAKAQEQEPEVLICAYAFMSSHYHFLAITPDAPTLSRFMNHFQGALARVANRLHGWSSRFWSSRYTSTLVSDEPEVQLERLRYILGQGCKENLVVSPLDWPGATSHAALMNGHCTIQGDWVNRTELYWRRRGGETDLTERDVTTRHNVRLAKLPAFEHLSRLEYAGLVKSEIREVERTTCERHRAEGTRPLGAERVLQAHPHSLPETSKHSQKPKFHATKQIFKILCAAYREFMKVFGAAVDRMRCGDDAEFPAGCFPPAMAPRARAPG